MIAGAVILLFFMQFAFDQQSVQETVQTREALVDLDDQLDAFAVSEASSKTIQLPKNSELSFSCEGLQLEDYARRDEKIIFSESFSADSINAWTLRWEFPFPVANLFYLDNGRRYILVYDQNSFTYVKDLDIPEIFSVQKQDLRNFNSERIKNELGGKAVTIAFFTSAMPAGVDKINADVIKIDTANNEVEINKKKDFYLGEQMMLGAIFGSETYSCMKERAIKKLNTLSRLHAQRASLLGLKAFGGCKNKLNSAQQTLQLFSEAKTKEQLLNLQEKIAQQNKDLEKDGCATLY